MTLHLRLQPRRSALLAGHDNLLDVLVRAEAMPAPAAGRPRPRLNLAIVIDRSGSMSGEPLDEAKRLAAEMVCRLDAGDRVAIIAYDDHVDVVVPSRPVGDRASILSAIWGIACGGMTALHAGWAAGAEQAARAMAEADLSRVLLLSDGCANSGLTDDDEIAAHCREMAEAGVSTSTYGLGTGFNEALMHAMAAAGGGIARYGRTAADLAEPFEEEFELLRALAASRVRLCLRPGPGVGLEIANDLKQGPDGWRLPDIAHGSEGWAVVRLAIPARLVPEPTPEPLALLAGEVIWQDVEGRRHAAESPLLSLPVLAPAAFAAVAEDPIVARRAEEVQFATVEARASAAARRGDWAAVDRHLAEARGIARDRPWLEASLEALETLSRKRERELFAKEAFYGASVRMSRLAAPGNAELSLDLTMGLLQPAFLRRKAEQGRDSRRSKGRG